MDIRVKMALDKIKGLLKPEDVQKACNEAVNRTMITFVNRASRAVWETLNTKLGDVKSQFKQRKANAKNGAAAEAYLSRQGIPLIDYMTSKQIFRGAVKRPRGGLKVRVRKTRGAETHAHSFVAMMKSGHIGIFHRVSGKMMQSNPKKQAIEEKRGPTVIGVLANASDPETAQDTILNASTGESAEVLAKNLSSQLERFLAKYQGA